MTPTPAAAATVGKGQPSTVGAAATPANGKTLHFVVQPGDTWTDVADRLQQQGVISSSFVFRVQLRLAGTGGALTPGAYTLQTGMTNDQIVSTLEHATAPEQVSVRFTEGWRMEQYADALVAKKVTTSSDFLSITKSRNTDFTYNVLAGRPAGATLEGYLFPDTYDFLTNASAHDIVDRMLNRFAQVVTPAMLDQARAQGHTLYQVLTVASIVEREAAAPRERSIIAGVYWNRLRQGECMCADPTVQYALGAPGAWWPVLNAEARSLAPDSAFNTYTHLGFPPGPIANPGLASIQATLNPQGNYLYFVAKGDGTHIFSRTLDEQNQNIAKLQQSSANGQ